MKISLDMNRLEHLLSCAETREAPELPASYLRDHVIYPSLRGEPVLLRGLDFTAFDEESLDLMFEECTNLFAFFQKVDHVEKRCQNLKARSSGVKFF